MHDAFINKPHIAFVISILLIITGLMSAQHIHVATLPNVTNPMVRITAFYPTADPTILEQTFVTPAEKAFNSLEGVHHIASSVASDGFAVIRVVFNAGTQPEKNEINVQNRLATILPSLPQAIQKRGVFVKSSSDQEIMAIAVYSPDDAFSPLQLSDYAARFMVKPLSRAKGVSNVKVSDTMVMNVSLNIEKLQSFDITIAHIMHTIQEQNQVAAIGQIGAAPNAHNPTFTLTISTNSLLQSLEQIKNIIVKADTTGHIVYLRDMADVKFVSQEKTQSTLNGKAATFIAIFQHPDANTLTTIRNVNEQLHRLSKQLPVNISTKVIDCTEQFISVSIKEVIYALIEAIILVILVVFLFLQNWRTTFIPAITIPIALIGTLTFMFILDYSINTITLFAILMSIGIVVDDAIIVVENVARHMSKDHLSPRAATMKAMREITAPILVTTCVLLSVFIPVAFLPGVQGRILQQFSVVLSITVAISSIVALTLSPALCATLLKPTMPAPIFMKPIHQFFHGITVLYKKSIMGLLARNYYVIALLCFLLIAAVIIFNKIPSGFIPNEDQGYIRFYIKLPYAMSTQQIHQLNQKITNIVLKEKTVANVAITPESEHNRSALTGFVQLTHWSKRTLKSDRADAVIDRLQTQFDTLANIKAFVYNPSLIKDSGTGKVSLQLQSLSGHSLDHLADTAEQFAEKAEDLPLFRVIFSNFDIDVPAVKLKLNTEKIKTLGIPLKEIRNSFEIFNPNAISMFYTIDQRTDIQLQAQYLFRETPESLQSFYVRNEKNEFISLASLVSFEKTQAASWIPHYNLHRSATIISRPNKSYSTGDAIKALGTLAAKLPQDYTYTWNGETQEQIDAAKQLPWLFLFAIVFIYLFLVVLYESWSLPLSVIIIIPTAILGSSAALLCLNMENNIYAQIGMLLLIGMTAKTTILITEFSIKMKRNGISTYQAALDAAQLRFRPVIMTSLSFILGVLPFLIASGPGANSRVYLGVTVFTGMIFATIVGILVTPSTYMVAQQFREYLHQKIKAFPLS